MYVLGSIHIVKGPRGALENWIWGQSSRLTGICDCGISCQTFPLSQTQAPILTPPHMLCNLKRATQLLQAPPHLPSVELTMWASPGHRGD